MTILDDNKYIAENNYRQYLQNNLLANETGEIEIDVGVAPVSLFGWLVIDPDSTANREEIFYHRVSGTSIFVYAINRTEAKVHVSGTAIVLNNTAGIYNFKEGFNDNIFKHYYTSTTDVEIMGGVTIDANGTETTIENTNTSTLGLTNNALNYIYISGGLLVSSTTDPVTAFVIKKITKDAIGNITLIEDGSQNSKLIAIAAAVGGDMLQSTYDTNNNGIVDNSELVNGLTVQTAVPSGAVFTDTTYSVGDGGLTQVNFTSTKDSKLSGIESLAEVNNISDINATDLTDAGNTILHYHSADRDRANHIGTQLANTISNFQTTVTANTNVTANTAARHNAVTVTDTAEVDLTLVGQDIKADLKPTTVVPGSYIHSSITVDSKGRITSIADGSISASPLTTKGDLLTFDTGDNRLAVGVNGSTLIADNAEATGLRWGSVAGTGDVSATMNLADNTIVLGDGGLKGVKTNGKTITTTLGADDTTVPTSKAVADAITSSGGGDLLSTNNLSDVASTATSRINLGVGTTDSPLFDTVKLATTPTNTTFEEGKMFYSTTKKTAVIMAGGGVEIEMGQGPTFIVTNNSGTNILNGQAVYLTGGSSDMPTVALAKANAFATARVFGIATENINTGTTGFITKIGIVHDLNTSTYTLGDTLYLSDVTAGLLTKTAPTNVVNYVVVIGRVLNVNATTGSIYVDPIFNNRLTDLSDVTIASPLVDDVLKWNGSGFINGPAVSASSGGGVTFYLNDSAIINPSTQSEALYTLSKTPLIAAEDIDSQVVTNTTTLIERYLYNSPLGGTTIDAGTWTFNTYGYVSSTTGISSIPVTVRRVIAGTGTVTITGTGTSRTATVSGGTPFVAGDFSATITQGGSLQTPNGIFKITGYSSSSVITIQTLTGYTNETGVSYSTHRYLFTDNNNEINNTSVGLNVGKSVQPAFTINATDKLSLSYYARTDSGTAKTIYLYHNGSEHYTNVVAPLVTRHDELAGLNAGEYQHLTSTQLSKLNAISGTNTGDQSTIVGISGTTAQFNTALSDGTFATGGGTATGTNTGDNAVNTLYSGLSTSKQNTLVSGTNIKTINSTSLLGSGDIVITGGSGDVVGPASSVDNDVALFNSTTGKLLKKGKISYNGTSLSLNSGEVNSELNLGLYATISGGLNVDTEQSCMLESTQSVDIKLGSGGYFNVFDTVGTALMFISESSGNITAKYGVSIGSTDTTLERVSAGKLSIEGVTIPTVSSTDTLTNKSLVAVNTFIIDATDATKRASFDTSGFTTATSNTFVLPDSDGETLVTDSGIETLTNKIINGTTNTIAATGLRTATTEVVVNAATAPTAGQVLTASTDSLASWVTPAGGGSKEIRIRIPGEQIADTAIHQGVYWRNTTGATITISNVAIGVAKAAAGTGAAATYQIYKSSGTASDGIDTSSINLFTSAIALGTGYTSDTNVPDTTTVEAGRWISARCTVSAGVTNKASDCEIIISYS